MFFCKLTIVNGAVVSMSGFHHGGCGSNPGLDSEI